MISEFECILKILHFHSPLPISTFNVLTSCVTFLFCISLNPSLWINIFLLLLTLTVPTSFISGLYNSFIVYLPLPIGFFPFVFCFFVFWFLGFFAVHEAYESSQARD